MKVGPSGDTNFDLIYIYVRFSSFAKVKRMYISEKVACFKICEPGEGRGLNRGHTIR